MARSLLQQETQFPYLSLRERSSGARVRGNAARDKTQNCHHPAHPEHIHFLYHPLMPANAGIHLPSPRWIPAFAGMSGREGAKRLKIREKISLARAIEI